MLHSRRVREVVLVSTTSSPSSYMYLVSAPLPAAISNLAINIKSHNQGFCDNPEAGNWSWFDISVLRPLSENVQQDLSNFHLHDQVRDQPVDFSSDLLGQGWRFVPWRNSNFRDAADDSSLLSRIIHRTPMARGWEARPQHGLEIVLRV